MNNTTDLHDETARLALESVSIAKNYFSTYLKSRNIDEVFITLVDEHEVDGHIEFKVDYIVATTMAENSVTFRYTVH